MIFQCLMSNSNFSLQIQTFSNLRKVVQIKPNQISNVKFKSNSNQTSFEAFPSTYIDSRNKSKLHQLLCSIQSTCSICSFTFGVEVISGPP